MHAYVETRSQKTKGSWPRQGPDTYIAVQIVPPGQHRLMVLNRKAANNRGIKIIYCGEGYQNRQKTHQSMLGRAKQKASKIADIINDFYSTEPSTQYDIIDTLNNM